MGRITVFALEECPHCRRAKSALKERSIPYVEVSLTTHPNRRSDMISLSDRLSVPQVFFNEQHVGGADDTLQLLAEWDKDTSKTPQQKYQDEIAAQPDPADARLKESTDPPVVPKEPLPRDAADNIQLPDGSTITVLDLVEKKLKPILSGQRKSTLFLTTYKHTFTGAEAVQALAKEFNCKETEAVDFGKVLMEREIIQPVGGHAKEFKESPTHLLRLQCYHTPHILNSYRVWNTRVDPDAMAVITRLKKLLGKVESAVTNDEGLVHYIQATQHEHYPIFEEAVCELQGMDLAKLDRNAMIAFGINAYNVFIKYAFIKVGIYNDPFALLAYFFQIKFDIGGHLFGFHDLESGILRGNRNAPYALSPPIPKNDPRLAFMVQDVDNRIHFGLNCGARSCPPGLSYPPDYLKSFTAEGIEEELRIVAMSFAEDDDNVHVDSDKRILSFSQIINWYRIDFAPSNKELPQTIVQFLRGDKKDKLQDMIDDGKRIKIKFLPYDWTTNAQKDGFLPFKKANIQ
ncbi:Glutaredoxin 3 [Seminavis robusta]|uniref:Glutaredoxin 3 n=1 Tax=Seminavis robusta TaxID=568900 RepID=A0A9N8E4P2_9STRA|nr:Glutaredoxin 3 [Seminavis robusta]|eukprot:Sro664_g183660.1 Glutaredoxin 3 (516) ;mRNA; f:29131-30961